MSGVEEDLRMAVNLVIEHLNRRHNVKAGPLKTLSAVLEEVCGKVKPSLDPGLCKLMHKGVVQDLSTPLRLLNMPSGTKLELVSDRQLGVVESHAAGKSADAQVDAMRSNEGGEKSAVGSVKAEERKDDGVHDEQISAGCGEAIVKQPDESEKAIESDPVSDAWASHPDVERDFSVYDRDSLVDDHLAEAMEDVPDEYYDFTAEDYQRVMHEHKARVQKEEAGLRTQAMREKEEQQRAQSLGMVNIRLIFPSGNICQAQFKATETVDALYDFTSSIATCRRLDLVLYTAPPRVDLTELEATLYKAMLVPAANIYVGQPRRKKGKNGGASNQPINLKDDVLKLKTNTPPILESQNPQKEDSSAAKAVQNADHVDPRKTSKAGQVPKWMKLGK